MFLDGVAGSISSLFGSLKFETKKTKKNQKIVSAPFNRKNKKRIVNFYDKYGETIA